MFKINTKIAKRIGAGTLAFSVLAVATPAMADDDDVQLINCEESLGTIALVDSPSAGWRQWELGSPRALITRLAAESGCFTPHAGGAEPARFLVTAIAGTQEEVDQGMALAGTAATEALVRSGAASSVLGSVPFGGAALGMLGGLGGRRTTVAAGLTVVSPSNGQTLASGQGAVSRTSISFRGRGGEWGRNIADSSGYARNSNGRKLTEAYIIAFNQLIAQRSVLELAPEAGASAPAASAEPEAPGAVVAIDTVMRLTPSAEAEEVRSLRAGTELNPTGNREGLWIEVTDNYGTQGWVSVEELQ